MLKYSVVHSAVCILTHHGLSGRGIESRWGGKLLPAAQTSPKGQPASCTRSTASFSRVKLAERGVDHPSSSTGFRMGWSTAHPFPLILSRRVMGSPLLTVVYIDVKVIRTVRLCLWLVSSQSLEASYCICPRLGYYPLKVKAFRSLETPEIVYPII